MTVLVGTIISAIFIMGVVSFLIIYTNKYVENEVIKTVAIIIYGLGYVAAITKVMLEAIKSNF